MENELRIAKETAETESRFQIVSRVKGTAPVVTPTANPLVALFSGPPCATGQQFRVAGQEHVDQLVEQADVALDLIQQVGRSFVACVSTPLRQRNDSDAACSFTRQALSWHG